MKKIILTEKNRLLFNYNEKIEKLPVDFFLDDTQKVAKALLGQFLVRILNGNIIAGKIVETEAYLGFNDPACHSYKGKSERVKPMFNQGGVAYVYFIYGMYHCFNVVTQQKGVPEAVLIRAIEPLAGIDIMKKLRDYRKNLTSGPANLCKAMEIDKRFNNHPLNANPLYLQKGVQIPDNQIIKTTRIGVNYAGEAARWNLRFYILNNQFISKK